MFLKKILSYFDAIAFSYKTNFLIFIITGGMICITILSEISIFSLKHDFDNLFERRTKPLIKLEEIKDTYHVNIYDTFYDIQQNNISNEHANEVITLAKQLINNSWYDYKQRIDGKYYKPSYITSIITSVYPITIIKEKKILQTSIIDNIEKRIKVIDVLMNKIFKFIRHNRNSDAYVLVDKLYFEINSINIYLTSLINYDLKLAINEKRKTEKVFNIIIMMSVISIIFVFLFSIILSVIIINNFKKLHNSLEQKIKDKTKELQKLNESLEKRIKLEVKNNRKKDLIMFQQTKLASMGEMLQNIAHQWRQPLGSLTMIIQSFQTKMMHGKLTDEFVDKKVHDSLLLADSMSSTLDDFRNFFNPDKIKTKFLLQNCLNHSLELSKYLLDKENIKISLKIREDVMISGFYNELSHVLLNIISNSKDALASKKENEEKLIYIVIKKVDNNAQIVMLDNGGGIPQKVLPKVFEPYYTTKYKSAGTGVGLYMSKQIIEKHMLGNITCKNVKHKLGTDELYDCAKFIINIPINQEDYDGK
jgi:signal transduction histidine kinase